MCLSLLLSHHCFLIFPAKKCVCSSLLCLLGELSWLSSELSWHFEVVGEELKNYQSFVSATEHALGLPSLSHPFLVFHNSEGSVGAVMGFAFHSLVQVHSCLSFQGGNL